MPNTEISAQAKALMLRMQRNEITEYYIYTNIAKRVKDEKNAATLRRIGEEERAHYQIWKSYTAEEIKPAKGKIFWLNLVSRVMGFTFAIKLMESGESLAAEEYDKLVAEIPEARRIMEDEERHENEFIELLDEERLQYVGSMVLGLNDALVELTGTLAGLTFALKSTRLIALSGLITGISATLSMASSEYLSARSEGNEDAKKSCIYTGIAYLVTVALLVLPYLLFPDSGYLGALITMIAIVVCIIAFFNYYIAVARSLPFKKRFLEMATISLSVAVISFVIGLLVKQVLGVDV